MIAEDPVRARHAVPVQSPAVADPEGHPRTERFGRPVRGSIPTIVRSFKSAVTRQVNELLNTPGARVWHRNYDEHIIRNEESLNQIRQYIADNPERWAFDRENPDGVAEVRSEIEAAR